MDGIFFQLLEDNFQCYVMWDKFDVKVNANDTSISYLFGEKKLSTYTGVKILVTLSTVVGSL